MNKSKIRGRKKLPEGEKKMKFVVFAKAKHIKKAKAAALAAVKEYA